MDAVTTPDQATPPAPRRDRYRRLPATTRREQLVQVALEVTRRQPATGLSAEAVAASAGVSKGLVFHYFPTTIDLQLAVIEHAALDLLDRLDVGPDVPVPERLRAGINAFIDFATEYADSYLDLARGGGTDPRIHQRHDETRARVASLIGTAMGFTQLPPTLRVVLRGYVGLIEETVLEWLVDRPVPREALVDYLCGAGQRLVPDALPLVSGAEEARHAPA